LIENAISGLIILAGITFANYQMGIIAFVSALVGTWIGFVSGAEKETVSRGLLGYNAVLTGLALFLFLSGGQRWWIAIVGAVVSVLVTSALMYVMRNTVFPVLTFPYIILTWFLLLASYHLGVFQLSSELVPQDLASAKFHREGTIQFLDGLVDGIGQVYFQQDLLPGVMILIGVFWASWRLGLYAVTGTLVAWLTAYFLQTEITPLNLGLYSYNGVLAILAVSCVFGAGHRMATLSGICAAILTVPITASLSTWLQPYGLPTLTMSFVLITWLFLGAGQKLIRLGEE